MAAATDPHPRLVVVYGHRSLDALQIRQAARGWCELVWLIDPDDPSAQALRPLLERSGPVVAALDRPAAEAAAALRPHAPDGIVTFYDRGIEHVAEIARELGLRFHAPDAARALEDKHAQRAALRRGGLCSPPVVLVPDGADSESLHQLAGEITYPAVLKPRRASGSWHTFRVDGPDELVGHLSAIGSGEDGDGGRGGWEGPEMLVEGYLPDGPPMPAGFEAGYVSVESLVGGPAPIHLAITGRLPLVDPLRETGFFIPSTLSPSQATEIHELATAALAAVGFEVGCAHTEVKLTSEGPQVIEINGRPGGGVADMLGLLGSIDLLGLTMRLALGLPIEVPELAASRGVAYRFFYQPPTDARRLLTLDGLDELQRHPGVRDVWLHHPPGTELDADDGTRTYLFAVLGLAPDHEGVREMIEHLEHAIAATYERGAPAG